MKKSYSDFTSFDFLKDESFILWQMSQIDDHLFWKDFLLHYPDKKREFEEAKYLINSIKLNYKILPSNQKTAIFEEILKSIALEKRKYNFNFIVGIAASIAIIIGFSLFHIKPDSNIANTEKKEEKAESFENLKNVQLVLSNDQTLTFENDATIKYDSILNIVESINDKELNKQIDKHNELVLNKLIVPKGKRSTLQLADGTKVWINSGTILHFPTKFEQNYRKIFVEGEIYLNVAKNNHKPFIVNVNDFKIEVLGTSFNVSGYKGEPQTVVLVEGAVRVKINHSNKEVDLLPNQKLNITDNTFKIETVDVNDYTSWKDGLIQLKSMTLNQIAKAISRYYDIPVYCSDEVENMKCSGKLVIFDDLDSILLTLRELFPVEIIYENSSIKILSRTSKK